MVMNDSSVRGPARTATMSATVTPNAVTANANAGDDAASSITVNTAAKPAPTFPPPKTDKPRPHVCQTCQRSFARLEHLKRHERSHTKEKPFECPECSRCFARRDLLLRHQQKLHQTSTPSSRPRNRRESTSGTPAQSRARKNSVAGTNAAGANGSANSMRPRANTISHVDPAAVQMIAAANASVSQRMPPPHHSRHPSLIGLPFHGFDHTYGGMAAAMGQRGTPHGLPKLETAQSDLNIDFASGLRTAPPMAALNPDFDFESLLFGSAVSSSTINPNALHLSDSPPSMALDPMSPFGPASMDLPSNHQPLDDNFDWLTGFENTMSFNTENVVDESSPSALSTTSQSGISDVMVDGSNHKAPAGTSAPWQSSMVGPPQMSNPFAMDLNGSVFPDLLNGAPLSPQPASQKINDPYFSAPPTSLSTLSPSIAPGLGTHSLNQTLGFMTGQETLPLLSSGNNGASPVTTITDATRAALVNALSQCLPFGGRKYSFSQSSPQSPGLQSASNATPDPAANLPSTHDLKRYVGAYISYFHPHLPFLHLPTLSFDLVPTHHGRAQGIGGSGCLLLSMATIGALYEMEQAQSMELFEMAKKMIFSYLEERRKADVRKADIRRGTMGSSNSEHGSDMSSHTPVWLVQAMLLNVAYGHNCGDKTASDIASTHCTALVSLAGAADLLQPPLDDIQMGDSSPWGLSIDQDEHIQWLQWKTLEERKRTLYGVFHISSILVSAYNHAPALPNSEILLHLPCDEQFFNAENAKQFTALGGASAANHNRITFHDALGELLRTNERQQQAKHQQMGFSSAGSPQDLNELPKTNLNPSTFGCLTLISALHNYIWETRQRHHNKVWTNEETEKMHRHIEPALRAWQSAWASNPHHSLERPNPFGLGPLSADAIPLLDLAYIRLFVNLARPKEKFWQRDWEGMAEEMARSDELVQNAEHSPMSASESMGTDKSENSMHSSVFIDSPVTQPSSTDVPASKFTGLDTRASTRREKHLRKAAFYAADSLAMSDKLGVTFADFDSRELPLQSAMCAFDCAQVLAEWVATLQDRVGRYLGILGHDQIDFTQMPALMVLEEEDVRLLEKIDEVLSSAEMKINMEFARNGMGADSKLTTDGHNGYSAKILRVTAYMLQKSAIWPVMSLTTRCMESQASHARARAEKSTQQTE